MKSKSVAQMVLQKYGKWQWSFELSLQKTREGENSGIAGFLDDLDETAKFHFPKSSLKFFPVMQN